jgi:hypothetical protein
MKKTHISLLIFLLFSWGVATSQSNPMEMGNFFIKNYSRDFLNGRGVNWTVAQDTNGIVLIGNHLNGIALYDGKRVKKINLKGLPYGEEGRKIRTDSKGNIYLASNFNFGYLKKNYADQYEYVSLSNSLAEKDKVSSRVWSSAILKDTIFFQTDSAVYKYHDNKLLRAWHFNPSIHIMHKVGNRVFVRQWGVGLLELIGNEFRFINGSALWANNRVESMYQLDNGSILMASRNIGFWLLKKDGSFEKAKTPQLDKLIIEGEVYLSNTVLSNGLIAVGTTKYGLILIDQNLELKRIINTSVGLGSNYVADIFEDRSNDIWVASNGASVVTTDQSLTYFTTTNGLFGGVGGMLRMGGRFFVKTGTDLYELIPPKDNFGSVGFKPQGVDEAGSDLSLFDDMLITTNNYNIKYTKAGKTYIIKTQYYTSASRQSKLNKKLLFSSGKGLTLHEYDKGRWSEKTIPNNIQTYISGFTEPEPGFLILNTTNGPVSYKYSVDGTGSFNEMVVDKRFGNNKAIRFFQAGTSKYYGYDSSYHFYAVNFKSNRLTYAGWSLDSLVKDGVFSITYNSESGANWFYTLNGLYTLNIGEKNQPSITKFPFEKVNMSELSSRIFAEGKGDNEVVWLGSQDEKLFRYIPSLALKKKNSTYRALITAVYYQDSAIALRNQEVPFRQNQFTFEVAYPIFGNEEKILFSYWLQGQDKGWGAYTKDAKKEYTNLHEGKYTLHVRAVDASGNESMETTMSFTILPPWYRTIWAYGLYLLTLVLCFIQFGKYQAKKSFLKAENERKNSELAAAKDLQNRLLPKTLPVIKNLDIAGYLRTSTEVGGDYYDFFEQPDGSLYAICGDATGHGTPSGMLVSITKAGIIGLPQMSPKDMLHELNRVVKKVDLGILRMSLNIALIKDNVITLSSAGMPPYFIYRAATNSTEEIQISGVPLGSFKDVHFDQTTTDFSSGDILVIISDGLPEAPNLAGELFDYQKLQDLISTFGSKTAQEIIDQLMIEADAWLSGNHNPDDITLVVIKHK